MVPLLRGKAWLGGGRNGTLAAVSLGPHNCFVHQLDEQSIYGELLSRVTGQTLHMGSCSGRLQAMRSTTWALSALHSRNGHPPRGSLTTFHVLSLQHRSGSFILPTGIWCLFLKLTNPQDPRNVKCRVETWPLISLGMIVVYTSQKGSPAFCLSLLWSLCGTAKKLLLILLLHNANHVKVNWWSHYICMYCKWDEGCLEALGMNLLLPLSPALGYNACKTPVTPLR